jgi:hypothetical protein
MSKGYGHGLDNELSGLDKGVLCIHLNLLMNKK